MHRTPDCPPPCKEPNENYNPDDSSSDPCKKLTDLVNCEEHDLTSDIQGILETLKKWDPYNLLLPEINFNVTAVGEKCECCVDGELKGVYIKVENISGSAEIDGDAPLPFGKRIKKIPGFRVGPFHFLGGTARLGGTLNGQASGDVSGSATKECQGELCITFSSSPTGAINIQAGIAGKVAYKWRSGKEKSVEIDYTPATADAPINILIKYDSCGDGLTFKPCLGRGELNIDLYITIPVYGRIEIWKEKMTLWKGNCDESE